MSIFKKDGGFFHTLIKWISGKNTADSVVDSANSWLDAQTGRALTGAQQQQNQFNSEQAQLSRDWSEQMDNTKYQRSVADMRAAGVNPALAMSGGVTAPPSSSTASSGSSNPVASMSDIMSMILGKKQGRLLDAQAKQARDLGDAALENAKSNRVTADAAAQNASTNAERLISVEQPLARSQVAVGRSVITLNNKSVDKMNKEIDQLSEDIQLTQLHEIASALDIIWKGTTWETNKQMLAAQVAKTISASALDYAMRDKAVSEKELNELQKDINQKDKFISDAIVEYLKNQPGTGWIQTEINKGSSWYDLLHGYGAGIIDALEPSDLDFTKTTSVSDRVARGIVKVVSAKNRD